MSGLQYTDRWAAGHSAREREGHVPDMRLTMPKWKEEIQQVAGGTKKRLYKGKLKLPYQSSNRIQNDQQIQELSTTLKRARIIRSRVCTVNQRTSQQRQTNQRLDEGQIMLQVWTERSHINCMSRKENQQWPRWWRQEQKSEKKKKQAKQFVQ